MTSHKSAAHHDRQQQNNLQQHSNTPMPFTTDASIQMMSSLEIAELTGKRHPDVKRDIESTLKQAGIGLSRFAQTYESVQGKEHACYELPRRECDLVISGYSVKYRLAIIDRWHQLEERQTPAASGIPSIDFNNPTQIAGILAQTLGKVQEQDKQIKTDKPKVDFHDKVAVSEGDMSVAKAAKLIGTGRNRLLAWMRRNKWVTRLNEPYQSKIECGLLDVKLGKHYVHPEHGLSQSVTTRVTAKGLIALNGLVRSENHDNSERRA